MLIAPAYPLAPAAAASEFLHLSILSGYVAATHGWLIGLWWLLDWLGLALTFYIFATLLQLVCLLSIVTADLLTLLMISSVNGLHEFKLYMKELMSVAGITPAD